MSRSFIMFVAALILSGGGLLVQAQDEPLNVVATTTIIADIAQNVGGDRVAVTSIVPPDTDIHAFLPDPRDIATLASADLILVNGLGLEGFLSQIIDNAGDADIVTVSDGVPLRAVGDADRQHDEHAHEMNTSSAVTAGYVTLISASDDVLIGGTTDVAAAVEVHQTVLEDDIARMQAVDGLPLTAGDTVRLEPGGYHLMFVGLTSDLLPDDTVNVTLNFESGKTLELTLPVQDQAPAEQEEIITPDFIASAAWVRPALADMATDAHDAIHTNEVDCVDMSDAAHEHEHDEDEHEAGECDPHVWLTPANGIIIAENIAAALSAADPDGAAVYQANLNEYTAQLEALDAEIQAMMAAIPVERRVLATNHDFLGYFADAYELEVVGVVIPGGSTLVEPSAQDIAGLIEVLQTANVPAIFAEVSNRSALVDIIADEIGQNVRIITLYSGALSETGSASTYIDLLRENARLITDALGN